MNVSDGARNPSKPFEEAIGGNLTVRNAATKQYLESARGHYVSALAGRNGEKQEVPEIRATVDACSVAEDHAFEKVIEAEEPAVLEQPGQLKTCFEMDVHMQLPKGLFNASEKQLEAIKLHLNKALARSATAQLAEVVNRLGIIGKGMGKIGASDLEAVMTVPSNSSDAKELKGVVDNSSLQKTVESLKAELENLKREHAETKDNDVGVKSAPKNCPLRFSRCKPEDESCLEEAANYKHAYEDVGLNKNLAEDLKIKAKGLKRESEPIALRRSTKFEKKPRLSFTINMGKEGRMSALDSSKSLPEKISNVCVSTSESSARIMNSEDDLESSTWRPEKSNDLERGKKTVINGRIEADKCDHAPEFAIRDYVLSARKKDISTNWPFSQNNLRLCLKRGVKNVLPPFQPVGNLKNGFVKRCLAEKSVSTEESGLHKRPSVRKHHQVPGTIIDRCCNQEFSEGYRDLYSFRGGVKEFAFKTVAVNCQSEVESVSTSNLPLSEVVSNEQEAAASATNKTKSSVSQISSKKCGLALKLRGSTSRGAAEDITSACTVPSEAMASKICPVCETFSSTSNTTLNAHIDQCLSSQSSPIWVKNSKLIKPRVKSRKMRSMVDICATAPCSTLEDLDRRNGSNWATNLDITTEDTGMQTEGSNHRVSSRYVANNRPDDSVYIDSSGRKICILSKFNERASSLFPKSRENLKLTKQSKKGKRCKLFSANTKRRLAKHLKYLRVTRQRKHLLSLNVKDHSTKECAAEDATFPGHERHMEHQSPTSLGRAPKVLGQKKQRVSGSSCRRRSQIIRSPNTNDPDAMTKVCKYDLRATKDLRVRSDHTVTGRTLGNKRSNIPKKAVSPLKGSLRTRILDIAGVEHKNMGSCRNKMESPPSTSPTQGNRETFLVPLNMGAAGFDGENTKGCVHKSLNSKATPVSSVERENEIQPDAVHNTGRRKLLHSCHGCTSEGMTSYNSKTGMAPSHLSNGGEWHSTCKPNNSAVDDVYVCSRDTETETSCADAGEESGTKQVYTRDGLRDTNSFSDHADGGRGNCGIASSARMVHGKEFNDHFSSISFAIGDTAVRLNPSLHPELQKCPNVYAPLAKTMQGPDDFRSPLFRDVPKACFPQHGLSEEQMFYSDVSAAERLELKTGDAILNFGHRSSFVDVDPIPIPGPPGSDLPCFSDMGSEDLQSTGLEQSFGDRDNVVDVDISDSLLSATSSISNIGVTDHHFYPGWLGAHSPPGALTEFSRSPAASRTEKIASAVNDRGGGQKKCSQDEVPWTSVIKFQESQLHRQQATSLVTFPGEQYSMSSLTKWPLGLNDTITLSSCRRTESENLVNYVQTSHQDVPPVKVSAEAAVHLRRTDDCDSISSTPMLRLMGKDLMVVNKDDVNPSLFQTAQNICVSRQMHPVAENSSKHDGIWEHHAPQSPAFMGPLLYERDPHMFSLQHFDVGSSNMINSFTSPKSGDMYVNNHMHSSFSVLGAAPLQR